jgi:ribosomal protein S6--L-glutamate ligase
VAELVVAVAGIPGAWSSESLAEALRSQGASSSVIALDACVHDISRNEVYHEGRPLTKLDGLVVKKLGDTREPRVEERIQMLEALELRGVRVISRPESIARAVDRYRMTRILSDAGIPMPRTIVTESIDEAADAVECWGKAVLKPVFTSKGRGMALLSRERPARLALSDFRRQALGPMYLQEFVRSPGHDVAVAILGGEVIGTYNRVAAPGSWMTTTAAGGRYEQCVVPEAVELLALEAARPFGLDFTCVDLVETEPSWLVYEVSAFGGFSGLKQACGVDGAALYAAHVCEQIRSR